MRLDQFYHYLQGLLDCYIPTFSQKTKTDRFPCWFNSTIIHNIRLKQKFLIKFRNSHDVFYRNKYNEYRKLVKRQISKAHLNHIRSIQNSIANDTQKFWSYVKAKKGETRIPGRMTYEDTILETPQQIVNAFAKFFQKPCSSPPMTLHSIKRMKSVVSPLR